MTRLITVLIALTGLAACSDTPTVSDMSDHQHVTADAPAIDPASITLGNGQHNRIDLSGSTLSGDTFTFASVTLDRPGFLVMHPFRDGAPVQTEYVGATPLLAGISQDVEISVSDGPLGGDNYIVMLHYDMNTDGIFDFGDGIIVPDAPVFEGTTLIAHRYTVPEY